MKLTTAAINKFLGEHRENVNIKASMSKGEVTFNGEFEHKGEKHELEAKTLLDTLSSDPEAMLQSMINNLEADRKEVVDK